MSLLFRRREVWLPTVWGLLAMLVVAGVLSAGLALSAYGLMAPQAPAPGARTLVVEGWLALAELRQAVDTVRQGRYERVLTSGGPIEPEIDVGDHKNFAARAAAEMRAMGLTEVPVIAVPAPASIQDRTYLSAVMVREWAAQNDPTLAALDLYSAGVHARRSWLVYRMALGHRVEVGVRNAQPANYDPPSWWASSSGVKAVIGETLSLAWTKCCFWPAAPGTHEERWALPAAPAAHPP